MRFLLKFLLSFVQRSLRHRFLFAVPVGNSLLRISPFSFLSILIFLPLLSVLLDLLSKLPPLDIFSIKPLLILLLVDYATHFFFGCKFFFFLFFIVLSLFIHVIFEVFLRFPPIIRGRRFLLPLFLIRFQFLYILLYLRIFLGPGLAVSLEPLLILALGLITSSFLDGN